MALQVRRWGAISAGSSGVVASAGGCLFLFPVRVGALGVMEWWVMAVVVGEGGVETWLTWPASLVEVEIKWSALLCLFPSVSLVAFYMFLFQSFDLSPRFVSVSLCLYFFSCSNLSSHFQMSYLPQSLCPSLLLSISTCLFVFPSPPFLLSLSPFPSRLTERGSLWCKADIYSRGSFISTVSLLKQWAGSQINKMVERMDLLRVLFSHRKIREFVNTWRCKESHRVGREGVGVMNKDLNTSQPVLKWAKAFRLERW